MPRPTTAPRRYAEAAFEIARRDGTLDAWLASLERAVAVTRDPRVAGVVDSPAIPFAARREILERLFADELEPPARNLVLLLAQRGRLGSLPAVTGQFRSLLHRERGIVGARVASAVPLEPAELQAIAAHVQEMTGSQVDLSTTVDPELIGGVTVRVGDRLIDASVRGSLERLREQLLAGAR